ncbi:hypothetical protein ABK040_005180 [Willaertia magna]
MNNNTYHLSEQLLNWLMYGASLMGAGGGGSVLLGRILVKLMVDEGLVSKITLIDSSNCKDDELGCVVAGMGSPLQFQTDSKNFNVALAAFEAMNNYLLKMEKKQLNFIIPGEVGSLNSLFPLYLSSLKGIPTVIGDSVGRAAPTLTMTTFAHVSTNPSFFANVNGEAIAMLVDGADKIEDLARPIISSSEFNQVAGMSLWLMNSQQLKQVVVPNGNVIAIAAGYFSDLASKTENPIDALSKYIPYGKILIQGKFKQNISTGEGFDLGSVVVSDTLGHSLVVYNQNENLFAFEKSSPTAIITAPDVIAYVRVKDGTFLSNADLATIDPNEEISVWALPCHPKLFNDAYVSAVVKNLMTNLGYPGPIVTLFDETARTSYFAYMSKVGFEILQNQSNLENVKRVIEASEIEEHSTKRIKLNQQSCKHFLKVGDIISVTVKSAQNLPKMDVFGLADPFVVIKPSWKHSQENYETTTTSIIKKNLNPVWNEVFNFTIESEYDKFNTAFQFNVWDKDLLVNDFIGEVNLDLKTETLDVNKEVDFVLSLANKKKKKNGTLIVSVKVVRK